MAEEVKNSSVTHLCGLDFNRCFTDLPFAGLIFQALGSACLPALVISLEGSHC